MNDSNDAVPGDGRNETEAERLDRNWTEILQELRVIQTGTQILTGFLLTIVFQQRFTTLNQFQLDVYLALVILAAATTALGLAPVSLHRALFRRQAKEKLVRIANRILKLTLVLVVVVLSGTVLLIFDVVGDHTIAIVVGILCLVAISATWLLLPIGFNRRHPRS
ncbi:MAG: DUF6328 family protein [Rhodoglobus sp.]